jgi:hypothetical protein
MIYGPLIVDKDPNIGYIVRSLEHIPARTIICEYSGEVLPAKSQVFFSNDSIMGLP